MTSIEVPSTGRLLELIDGMAGQPLVMLADLVADRFISGTPKRISREAPVLILRVDSETLIPGGGANAVANVAALGGRPLPLGAVGDDAAGLGLLQAFEERGIATEGILVRPNYRTPTKTRILGGARHAIKQQIVRYDVEETLELTGAEQDRLLDVLSDAPGSPRVAVVSDYGYGTASPQILGRIRRILGEPCQLLGDSRYRLDELEGLDGATPNAEEAEEILDHALEGDAPAIERGGRELLARLGVRFLLITLGSDGMALFTASGAAHLPIHGSDQVADVTGAGDTVIGAFALTLAAGGSPLEAACLADYAGGVVVMKSGTATLSADELRTAVESDPIPLEKLVLRSWT